MDEIPRPNIGIGQGGWGNLDLYCGRMSLVRQPVTPVVEDNASQFYREMQRLQSERGPAVSAYQSAIA